MEKLTREIKLLKYCALKSQEIELLKYHSFSLKILPTIESLHSLKRSPTEINLSRDFPLMEILPS